MKYEIITTEPYRGSLRMVAESEQDEEELTRIEGEIRGAFSDGFKTILTYYGHGVRPNVPDKLGKERDLVTHLDFAFNSEAR